MKTAERYAGNGGRAPGGQRIEERAGHRPADMSPERIEEDLEAVRRRMSETLDEIGVKLSPGDLVDRGLEYLREGPPRDYAMQLGGTVRDNPIPAAMIGIGLAWLLAGARGDQREEGTRQRVRSYAGERAGERDWDERLREAPDRDERYRREAGEPRWREVEPGSADWEARRFYTSETAGPSYGGPVRGRASAYPPEAEVRGYPEREYTGGGGFGAAARHARERVGETAAGVGERVREAGAGARERVGEAVSAGRERLSEAASAGRERLGEAAADIRHGAEHLGERGRRGAERVRGTFFDMLEEQPLVLGALGVALGAVAGGLLPATRQEDEWLGETRDRLKERAGEGLREGVSQAADVAAAAGSAAAEEAHRQGIGPGEVMDEVRERAGRVGATARAEAERQRLTPEGARSAREAGQRAARDVGERAARVAEATDDEARRQGFTREGIEHAAGETADKVRKVAEAAREGAQSERDKIAAGGTSKEPQEALKH